MSTAVAQGGPAPGHPDEPPGEPAEAGGGPSRRRWRASAPALLLAAVSVLVAVPVAIVLTPDQQVVTLGQHLAVGGRLPGLSAYGPAQVVQVGNTSLDVPALQVVGPLRPRLEMGPTVRNEAAAGALDATGGAQSAAARTIGGGWLRWCAWGYLVALGVALGLAALASWVRLLRHHDATRVARSAVAAMGAVSLVWAASCAASVAAASGLRDITSFADLVGRYRLSPTPVGPELRGYTGVVIGDSRVSRLGGPLVADPGRDDRDCGRSTDSLAAELASTLPAKVLNLACPSATIREGLLGSQQRSGRNLPPQVGILKQVKDLRFVVVAVGPNDLRWSELLAYCFGARVCDDNLIVGDVGYRLAAFDRDYGQLLAELADLPGSPRVIVMTSYDVMTPDAAEPGSHCADARGPSGAVGLTPGKVRYLTSMNDRLNQVLVSGAETYRFAVARPRLSPLCQAGADGLGPDLQGLDTTAPFHPTGLGTVRLAAAVARTIPVEPGG